LKINDGITAYTMSSKEFPLWHHNFEFQSMMTVPDPEDVVVVHQHLPQHSDNEQTFSKDAQHTTVHHHCQAGSVSTTWHGTRLLYTK